VYANAPFILLVNLPESSRLILEKYITT
jgi:hypothetical protein